MIEPNEVSLNCHTNEKAEGDPREAKAAVVLSNALTVASKCQETRPSVLLVGYLSLNPNWQKSYGKKGRTLVRGWTPNGIVFPVRSTEA